MAHVPSLFSYQLWPLFVSRFYLIWLYLPFLLNKAMNPGEYLLCYLCYVFHLFRDASPSTAYQWWSFMPYFHLVDIRDKGENLESWSACHILHICYVVFWLCDNLLGYILTKRPGFVDIENPMEKILDWKFFRSNFEFPSIQIWMKSESYWSREIR